MAVKKPKVKHWTGDKLVCKQKGHKWVKVCRKHKADRLYACSVCARLGLRKP